MIPLDEKEPKQEELKEKTAGEESVDKDLELVIRMAIKMLTQANGLQLIKQSLDQSKDPAQVIGQFLATMMGKLAEECRDKLKIDPAIFLRGKGFLDAIINYIEQKLGMPPEFSDQIYAQVLEVVKAGAQNPTGAQRPPQQGQQAPQQAQPAGPQQAGDMNGGML